MRVIGWLLVLLGIPALLLFGAGIPMIIIGLLFVIIGHLAAKNSKG